MDIVTRADRPDLRNEATAVFRERWPEFIFHDDVPACCARPRGRWSSGTVAEWEGWTGMRFPATRDYVVPGALNPVRVDRERDLGRYVEENLWVQHR